METNEQLQQELARLRRRAEEAEAGALEERRQREEAEARIKKAEARIKEAETRALGERRQREEAEKAIVPVNFHTFLALCHRNLQQSLTVQENPDLTSSGTYTNVDSKYYPLYLKPWADFPSLHARCQARLESVFDGKNVFPSINSFNAMNDILGPTEPMAVEDDMRRLQFVNVESGARRVLFQYLKEIRESRDQPPSEGSTNTLPLRLYFSNSSHGILLDEDEEGDENQNSGTRPAYKPVMLAAQETDAVRRGDGPPPAKRKSLPKHKLYPDQWFMRLDSDGSIVPVFVVEYKAAHKLRAATLTMALTGEPRDPQGLFAAAIREQMQETISRDEAVRERVHAVKATARVLSQAFHYMVEFGLCYSYVASGEALVLLYFDAADVRTLYYHLAVPGKEVGTGAAENVRCTEVSLVSTLALLALDTPALSQRWKRKAEEDLKQWPIAYDEMLDDSEEDQGKGRRKGHRTEGTTRQQQRRKDDDDDADDADRGKDRAFRAPKASGIKSQYKTRNSPAGTGGGSNSNYVARHRTPLPYCSQACILGLRTGGPLDLGCPNVRFHRHGASSGDSPEECHGLTAAQFRDQMRQQLADDLDENCDALDKYGKYGATGMLFRLTLRDYGYCVVAKGVQRWRASRLEQEVAVYDHLLAQQGTLVPVCLGTIDLVYAYKTAYGARISHMMLLAYGGEHVYSKAAGPLPDNINKLVWDAWVQLGRLGVRHGDDREENMLWNAALQRPMCIDFELAKIVAKKEEKRKQETETQPDPVPVPSKRPRPRGRAEAEQPKHV